MKDITSLEELFESLEDINYASKIADVAKSLDDELAARDIRDPLKHDIVVAVTSGFKVSYTMR